MCLCFLVLVFVVIVMFSGGYVCIWRFLVWEMFVFLFFGYSLGLGFECVYVVCILFGKFVNGSIGCGEERIGFSECGLCGGVFVVVG